MFALQALIVDRDDEVLAVTAQHRPALAGPNAAVDRHGDIGIGRGCRIAEELRTAGAVAPDNRAGRVEIHIVFQRYGALRRVETDPLLCASAMEIGNDAMQL